MTSSAFRVPIPKWEIPTATATSSSVRRFYSTKAAAQSLGFIDLYKQGFFILEAKQGSEADSMKAGHGRRHTPAWEIAMQRAFGQALKYSQTIEDPPPFIVITDIGYCFDLYAAFDGTRNYRKFPDAVNSRIYLEKLESRPEDLETLKQIFLDPHALDPSKRTAKVTREIAAHVAHLAKALQESGHEPERVAKFLMRCLFTMSGTRNASGAGRLTPAAVLILMGDWCGSSRSDAARKRQRDC